MDTALWATWYDLPTERAQDYLAWLHAEYLPQLQARPGIAWVAHYKVQPRTPHFAKIREALKRTDVPGLNTGSQYAVLVGAASALTFFSPSVLDVEAAETGRAREMLDLRQSSQTYIYSEFARVNGPEFHLRVPGTTPAPAIQMGTLQMKTVADEHELAKWYAQYRLPHMARMPGSIATRVMACIHGWPKFGVLYEFASLEARHEHFEVPHESLGLNEREWTGRIARTNRHAPGSPIVGERIWPPIVG